jgi:hypothetical protein
MGRRKGSRNKKPAVDSLHTIMTIEERLEFIARLIVDRIENDQASDCRLLEEIGGRDEHKLA